MRYTWDEAKRIANLHDHGIDFVDAEKVFASLTFTYEDDRFPYGERRFDTSGYWQQYRFPLFTRRAMTIST